MPVWAAIVLPLVALAWVGLLVYGAIRDGHDRRIAAERFDWWMNQPRPYDHERD